ncbi:Indole-3-acetic acid-amido synthetase GH3.4, partial [Cucurbita argyrosperma subsp. argyrosperma]
MEAILCADSLPKHVHPQMLCGLLMRRQVLRVGAIFASTLPPRPNPELPNSFRNEVPRRTGRDRHKGFGPTLNTCRDVERSHGSDIHANPTEIAYTILPNMAYFEFLPYDTSFSPNLSPPRLVDLADVEIGKSHGFHNMAPQFRFVKRKNAMLCIDVDNTDEAELQQAVENASVLFAETLPNSPPEEILNQCCLTIEESLNSVYIQSRVSFNSVGPLEIRGNFSALQPVKAALDTGVTPF